jgi:replicative DNA helicase
VGTFLPGDLILIAARPSMGKTYLTLELSRNMVRNSLNVVFFSIEMTKQKIIYRQLARETKINSRKFRTSSFTDDELENVSKAISNICFQKMIIDDKSKTTPAYVRNKIISENKKRKVDAVFIDYFGLMKPDREYSDKYHEASSISEGIKTLTKDLDIPVFCVCQLNRECEKRQDKRPMLSDLRESGSLEQDADIVLFLHRDSYYNRHKGEPDDGDTEIIVAKNRDGQLGIVKTKMIPEWGEFKEL